MTTLVVKVFVCIVLGNKVFSYLLGSTHGGRFNNRGLALDSGCSYRSNLIATAFRLRVTRSAYIRTSATCIVGSRCTPITTLVTFSRNCFISNIGYHDVSLVGNGQAVRMTFFYFIDSMFIGWDICVTHLSIDHMSTGLSVLSDLLEEDDRRSPHSRGS